MPLSKIVAKSITDDTITTDQIADTSVHGRRSLVINGAFQIWQRATSNSSVTSNSYPAADRWKFWANGSTMGTTRTAFTVGQTDVPNIKYYNSIAIASNSGTGHYHTINHHVEDITRFDNVTVTLSFYAKASVAWTVGIEPIQNFGSGGSPSSRVLGTTQTVSVGTSWARHEVTISLASISGKTLGTTANTSNFEIAMWLSGGSDFNARTGSIGNQSGTIDIAAVQLEFGNKATPFEHRSYGEELALCQRYFYAISSNGNVTGNSAPMYEGHLWNNGFVKASFDFPVHMRAVPTLTAGNDTGAYRFYRDNGNDPFDTLILDVASQANMTCYQNSGIAGTAGQGGSVQIRYGDGGSLEFSAEL